MFQLGLRENRTTFSPGEELAGAALWEFPEAPSFAEVRLVWSTKGKGSEDAAVVDTISFPSPQPGDTRPFKFELPESPYSFSGKLISLVWAVELVLQPGNHCARCEIVVAPDGKEVILPRLPKGS